jgi:pyruvate dehydrogenase E2 component (dihydrolipoamide acetyltransferase)
MATPVEVPKLGNTVEECIIGRWVKHAGDAVAPGDIIAEIETDKTTFEVTAPLGGTLLATFFEEGAVVPVFTNFFVIGAAGENAETFRPRAGGAGGAAAATTAVDAATPATAAPTTPTPAAESAPLGNVPLGTMRLGDAAAGTAPWAGAGARPTAPAGSSAAPVGSVPRVAALAATPVAVAAPVGSARMSPRARRFAEVHAFHPASVAGSGPGGRILEADLRALYEARPKSAPKSSRLREIIARRMRESLSTTAQYTMNASANAAGLLVMRARIKASAGAADININHLVAFCTIRALVEVPSLNAEFVDGRIQERAAVDLGFACDTPKGLLVPVVRNAQALPLTELAARMKDLTARAVAGAIAPDDLSGGSFTVSNLGNLGIEWFTPLLNPPQVAILGVNAIQLKPVRRDGRVEFIDAIGFSLTCDHQAIDGAPGARFLQVLKAKIEGVEAECQNRF